MSVFFVFPLTQQILIDAYRGAILQNRESVFEFLFETYALSNEALNIVYTNVFRHPGPMPLRLLERGATILQETLRESFLADIMFDNIPSALDLLHRGLVSPDWIVAAFTRAFRAESAELITALRAHPGITEEMLTEVRQKAEESGRGLELLVLL